MPPLIPQGNVDYYSNSTPTQGMDDLASMDLGYDYPTGNNTLRPGKPLHDMIVSEVNMRALEAYRAQQPFHDRMREMDDIFTAYIPLDDREVEGQAKDKRKPVSTIVPITYAIAQVIQTQWLSLLSQQENLDQFLPGSPEDAVGAMLGELLLARQSAFFGELSARAVQVMDMLKYGFGVITPVWEERRGYRTTRTPETAPDPYTGQPIPTGGTILSREEYLQFEGNNVRNVDPYRYLQDPNVSHTRVQDAEYVGFTARENRMTLLEREASAPDQWFNMRYVEHCAGTDRPFPSALFTSAEQAGGEGIGNRRTGVVDTRAYHHNRVDVLYLYMTIIPAEWRDDKGNRLSPRTTPEKWLFGIAGDRILICARPLNLDHNLYPICVLATENDGYSAVTMAMLEITRGMQTALNFKWNSDMAFAKRFLKGRVMGDHSRVNVRDVVKGAEFIRVNRLAFGTRLGDVLAPVQTPDVTHRNISDMSTLTDIIERATGATQVLQGVMSDGERKSATEAQGVLRSSLGRVEKMVLLAGTQCYQHLSWMKFSQTAQFLSQDTYVRMAGRWEADLLAEYGKQATSNGWAQDSRGMFPVRPGDLDIFVDVIPLNPTRTGQENFDTWVQLYNMVQQNPAMMQAWDMVRMLKHIARLGGARNASDFALQDGQFVAQTVGDQQALEMAKAGNAIPVGQAAQAGMPGASAPSPGPAQPSGGQPLDY